MGVAGQQRVRRSEGSDGAQVAAPERTARPPDRRTDLVVGRADDRAERDADAVAASVLRVLDRATAIAVEPSGTSALAGDAMTTRRSSTGPDRLGGQPVDEVVEREIGAMRGRGAGLATVDRAPMERAFGRSFSSVKVHTGRRADVLSRQLDASAFTVGDDIFFRRGAYRPGAPASRPVLAHELAHVDQHRGPVRRSTVIRRRFGLEVELQQVFVGSVYSPTKALPYLKVGETMPVEPKYQPKQPILGVGPGGGFDVHADHSDSMGDRLPLYDTKKGIWRGRPGKGPIVELVTHPFDEFTQTNADIKAVMDAMKALAIQMASTATWQKFSDLGITGPTENFVGDPVGLTQGLMKPPPAPKTGGQIQVTMGVRLDRIKQLLELQGGAKDAPAPPPPTTVPTSGPAPPPPPAMAPKPTGTSSKRGEANLKGVEIADAICNDLFLRYQDKKTYQVEDKTNPGATVTKTRTFKNKFVISDQAALADLRGLLGMLANYLVAGRSDLGFGWGKNKVGGLFYKSKLSDVRNGITGEASTVIDKRVSKIKEALLEHTGRTSSEGVLLNRQGATDADAVTCGKWLDKVLSGKGDPLFDKLKNAYAKDIQPEMVGPTGSQGMAAVIENRTMGDLLSSMVPSSGGALVQGRAPADWPKIATSVADMLRVLNAAAAPTRTDMNTAVGR